MYIFNNCPSFYMLNCHCLPPQDVYETFNILMRRKPKENNFKAVLETIRDLMNNECVVPDWLHDIILGYGDPGAAHYSKYGSRRGTRGRSRSGGSGLLRDVWIDVCGLTGVTSCRIASSCPLRVPCPAMCCWL